MIVPSQLEELLKMRSTWESFEAALLLRKTIARLVLSGYSDTEETPARRITAARQATRDQVGREELSESDEHARFVSLLDQLATSTSSDYVRLRDKVAEKLGVTVGELDREVRTLREKLPAGPPLHQRARFPEALDAREIADLWTDEERARDGMVKMLIRAAHTGAIKICGQVMVLTQPEPAEVAKVLQKQIVDVSSKFRAKIDREVSFLRNALIDKCEQDLSSLRDEIRDAVAAEIAGLRAEMTAQPAPEELRRRGGLRSLGRRRLWASAKRPPIPGETATGYSVGGQQVIPVFQRDAFREWLENEGEWPVANHRQLARWWAFPSDERTRKTAGERRAIVLDRIVTKLIEEEGTQLARWNLAKSKRELFDLCRAEDPHLFQSMGTFNRWWQEETRKQVCRTPHDY